MKQLDLRLCVLTESVPSLGRTHADIVTAALQGGATMIQFRDKEIDDETFAAVAKQLLSLTRSAGIPFIVNDRVQIAIGIGADGIHIGQEDGDPEEVRKQLPKNMIFGVSARNYSEVISMDALDGDYLGVGPIFPTKSKGDAAPAMGEVELCRSIFDAKTPIMCIGGINAATLPLCIAAGAHGSAVISAVTRAADMVKATKELIGCWNDRQLLPVNQSDSRSKDSTFETTKRSKGR